MSGMVDKSDLSRLAGDSGKSDMREMRSLPRLRLMRCFAKVFTFVRVRAASARMADLGEVRHLG